MIPTRRTDPIIYRRAGATDILCVAKEFWIAANSVLKRDRFADRQVNLQNQRNRGFLYSGNSKSTFRALMLIEISKVIRTPKPFVFAWLTDYQESDPQYTSIALKSRKVLQRNGEMVLLEDTRLTVRTYTYRMKVLLHPPDTYEAHGETNDWKAYDQYQLTEVPEGTRLDMRFGLTFKGAARIIGPLLKPYISHRLEEEWDQYVAALEHEHAEVKDHSV